MQILTGNSDESYVWDEVAQTLKKVLISEPVAQTVPVNNSNNNKEETSILNSDKLKLLLIELKIPLYLIAAGLGVILLIILLERRTK